VLCDAGMRRYYQSGPVREEKEIAVD